MVGSVRTQNYTYGRGEVAFALFKAGTVGASGIPDGYRYLGNTPAFGFTNQVTELDHRSSDHGVGELDFSIATQVTRSGTVTTDNINRDNLALAFFGTKATVTQAAVTGNVEPTILAVTQGYQYQLGVTPALPTGVRNIQNVIVKVAGVTKTPLTDYTFDPIRGLVTPTEGGTIATGQSMDVTYDTIASSYDQVLSGSTPIEGAIMFTADNPSGPNRDVLLPWVRLTPNGEFALKAENALQQLAFTMKVLKPFNKSACYVNGQPYVGS